MGLTIDTTRREAAVGGRALALEPKLFDLLACLVDSQGELISKDKLLEVVWDGRVVSDAAISQAVAKLRRAIRDAGIDDELIKTVHGHGYRWAGPNVLAPSVPPEPATVSSSATGSPAARPGSGRGWRWVGFAVLAAAGLFLGFRPQQAAAPATLAMAPLAIADGSDIDWAELGLASLLGASIDDRTPLTVISPSRVRSALRSRGLDNTDPASQQLAALSELSGVDHLLLARVSRSRGQYQISYELASAALPAVAGTVSANSVETLAVSLTQAIADELDVAYAAGISLKKISPDDFVNEGFARGMQALLSGEIEQSRAYFESVLASDPRMGWARYELGNAQRQLGQWEASADTYQEVLAQTDGDLNLAGAALSGLGILAWRAGDLVAAEQHLMNARQQFETVGNDANLASALGNLGILAENQGRIVEARELYGRTLALYRAAGQRFGESSVYVNLASLEMKQGRLAEADELQRRGVAIQEQVGLRPLLVFSYAQQGQITFALGRWEEGREFLNKSLLLADELGDSLGAAEARSALSAQLILQGRLDDAESNLLAALQTYEALNNPLGEGNARLLLAEVARWRENAAESHRQAILAHEIFAELDYPRLTARALIARATGSSPDQARADLSSALTQAQKSADSGLLAQVLIAQSELAPTIEDVLDHLSRALEHAHTAGDRGLEARTAIALALALLDSGQADSKRLDALLGLAQTWQPDYHELIYLEARILADRGQPGRALEQMERAREAAGGCWQSHQQARLDRLRSGQAA